MWWWQGGFGFRFGAYHGDSWGCMSARRHNFYNPFYVTVDAAVVDKRAHSDDNNASEGYTYSSPKRLGRYLVDRSMYASWGLSSDPWLHGSLCYRIWGGYLGTDHRYRSRTEYWSGHRQRKPRSRRRQKQRRLWKWHLSSYDYDTTQRLCGRSSDDYLAEAGE